MLGGSIIVLVFLCVLRVLCGSRFWKMSADHPLDRPQLRVYRYRLRAARDGGLDVLQTVPGQRVDDGAALADLPELWKCEPSPIYPAPITRAKAT